MLLNRLNLCIVNFIVTIFGFSPEQTITDNNISKNESFTLRSKHTKDYSLANITFTKLLPSNSSSEDSRNSKHICFPFGPAPTETLISEYEDCKSRLFESLNLNESHPDQYKTTPEVLERNGYSYKEYKILTDDQHILTAFRITDSPNWKKNEKGKRRHPIYFNHGLVGSSEWWLLHPHDRSLPLIMADAGYDVWLSNQRGSTYSREHQKCHWETDLCYWNYSFHELGIYDVPAVTDTIIAETKHDKISYIGYSLGTTQFFVSLSELPEMSNKIQAAYLLAPVAFMGHSTSPLRSIISYFDSYTVFQTVNIALKGRVYSIREFKETFKLTGADMCTLTAAKCGLCDNLWFSIMGYNEPQMNRSALPLIFSRMPNSQSVKVFAHYAQLMSSCKFQKFNYGPALNFVKYGSQNPPEYNLKNIKAPLYFYHSYLDNFGVPLDVEITTSQLRKGVLKGLYKVKDPLFNHADFVFAKDADLLVYNKLLKDMKKHNA